MNEIKRLLESLSWKQMLSLTLAAGAVLGSLVLLSRWSRERDFRPLFSALSPEDAGAVLAKVRETASTSGWRKTARRCWFPRGASRSYACNWRLAEFPRAAESATSCSTNPISG